LNQVTIQFESSTTTEHAGFKPKKREKCNAFEQMTWNDIS